MKLKTTISWVSTWHLIIGFVVLAILLWWRWELSLIRYFDVDEFAYLSWSRMVAAGKQPFVDFFFFIPPTFLYVGSTVFHLFGGTEAVIVMRALMFALFTLLIALLMATVYLLRRSVGMALSAAIILVILPLPFDKFIEIRPDTLAMVFLSGGVLAQLMFMRFRTRASGILAGVCYSLSLLTLPKGIGQVGLSLLVLFVSTNGIDYLRTKNWRDLWNTYQPIVLGFLICSLPFGFWALVSGRAEYIIYSITVMPREIMNIAIRFYMSPTLFFYPNAVFYGAGGHSVGFLLNNVLWIIGLGWGLVRLITPAIFARRAAISEEILIAIGLWVNVFFYIQVFPLKHSQYLIPVAVYIAWYVADVGYTIWNAMIRPKRLFVIQIFSVCAAAYAVFLYQQIHAPKMAMANTEVLSEMRYLWSIIPKDARVFDLDGRLIYYDHPYFGCCLPFGQFSPYLTRMLPSIAQTLEEKKVPYVYQGDLERIMALTETDAGYIYRKYELIHGKTLWRRKK